MSRPLILGLTGSIGMGKSTVLAMFADLGVPVFDADAEVRRMQGPDGTLLPAIEEAFPGSTGPEGVKRKELGALVFDDPDALTRLEAIVHPAVREARAHFLTQHIDAPLVVFDIPLLFEKTNVDDVDHVVVVSAPEDVQRERVLARPDMTSEKLAKILAQQMPDAEKRARADFVIDTGCSLEETAHSVAELVRNLTS
jgi:dephospho-CoA kinase